MFAVSQAQNVDSFGMAKGIVDKVIETELNQCLAFIFLVLTCSR